MNKIFRKEVTIGIIVIISLFVLFLIINFLKGVNLFKAANYYTATYENVQGLAVSAPVTVNGFKIGLVREINYEYDNPGHISVEISVEKELKLPVGTVAVLTSDFLGTASIELKMGLGSDYYEVGSELDSAVSPGLMDNLSTSVMPALDGVFAKVDTLIDNLNTITGDPALRTAVGNLDNITTNLETATEQLNKILATLPPITSNVENLTGSLAAQSEQLSTFTGKLSNVPVDSLATNVAAISSNLKELTAQLNDPNSTVGKLTHDPQLYNSLNATAASLDSLLVDIKKNPKRYISIKLF